MGRAGADEYFLNERETGPEVIAAACLALACWCTGLRRVERRGDASSPPSGGRPAQATPPNVVAEPPHYATEGMQDPVRIVCVPGSYVPRFSEPAEVRAPKQAPPPRIPVAVLPFLNLSPDLESAYFCDGLTEELIYVLSKNPALRVVAGASSLQFKGTAQDVRIIGHKLGAQYLVDGTVRRSGGEVRVTVGLVSVSDGCQIWAERYDREMADES